MTIPYPYEDEDNDSGIEPGTAVLIIRDSMISRASITSSQRRKFDKHCQAGGSVHILVDEFQQNDGPIYSWTNLKRPEFECYNDWLRWRESRQEDPN